MEEYYYLVNIRKCINFFVIKHIFLLLIPGIPFALVELQPLYYEEGSQMKMIRLVLVLVMVILVISLGGCHGVGHWLGHGHHKKGHPHHW